MRTIALLCLLPLVAVGQDKPLPPAEAAAKMTLPPGFQATLFAGEPAVVQPIAFTFDDRGRMWVVECLSYPNWKADGTGSDRVTMFEDTDGDGKHDVRHVVFDQGSNLSGIELGFGGIWLCSVPNLVFLPCDFNADKPTPKGKAEIVLDGWNLKDTKHNIFNSLIWGPDGWLYGCNGIQSRSFVAKPGTPMKDRKEFNCGVWRYHPTRKVFEPFAHGTTNPFGLDYDENGEFFITNCVIKHVFHVAPGGHYDRMYGQDVNPFTYKLMPSIADYLHWAGGDWTTSRGNKPEHSDAGGGHAHSGCMIYLGDNFPEEYRGSLFTCNIHGNRLNRDTLHRHGSGFKAERAKDFAFANDPWFRGIAVKYGPDGGVFVSDWCDTGECHNYDKADTSNGRIHKITYGKPKPWNGDLSKLDNIQLLALHDHKNAWFVRHARRLLTERAAEWTVPFEDDVYGRVGQSTKGLEYDLTLLAAGKPGPYIAMMKSGDKARQTWATRHVLHRASETDREVTAEGVRLLLKLSEPHERLALAGALTRPAGPSHRALIDHLLGRSVAADADDAHLPLAIWYAVEPWIGSDPAEAVGVLERCKIPLVAELVARKSTSLKPSNVHALSEFVGRQSSTPLVAAVLQGIIDGLAGFRTFTQQGWNWYAVSATLLSSKDAEVRKKAMSLAVLFEDKAAIKSMQATAVDPKVAKEDREVAVRALLRRGKPDLLPILNSLLGDLAMRGEAIRGLAAFDDPATAGTLIDLYPKLGETEKEDAVQTLASRPSWAMSLLTAVERKLIPRSDVPVFVARQIQGLKDKAVVEKLAAVWGRIESPSAQRAALTIKYKSILTDEAMKSADESRGRQVYVKNCASCHKLYDDGGDIGPALTGSQRSNLDYLLENVLDPSAVVPREYQVVVIDLKNSRRINGIVRAENDKSVTIQTTNETLVLPKEEIEERTQSKVSMMPEGIFDKLSEAEVRDLVAYLRGRQQVPLPK